MKKSMINSIGMKFVHVPKGSFIMGDELGDIDEKPVHKVNICGFDISTTQVTNVQYENFNPNHEREEKFSDKDNDAVVNVSFVEAEAFCRWLSIKENKQYRLPTEAEWEYACRAGSFLKYSMGDVFPEKMYKNQQEIWQAEPVSLRVAEFEPNDFGLYDCHGNVEEWCSDWYGKYQKSEQNNPRGYKDGIAKVTRGGSHNTDVKFLTSASRMAALPCNKHKFIGFRVVCADLPKGDIFEQNVFPSNVEVSQKKHDYDGNITQKPFFTGPIPYITQPNNEVPFYRHNHCPGLTWCDNGDLLAIWFSCNTESGREMTILGSRLKKDSREWTKPCEFFDVADRNTTGSSLFHGCDGSLIHINGVDTNYGWGELIMIMRKSFDNGFTWTKPAIINSVHGHRNQPISGGFVTEKGFLVQACDASPHSSGGTAIHISEDNGHTWIDYGKDMPTPIFEEGKKGGWIAGIHAGVVSIDDDNFIALGRSNDINDKMPMSVSNDGGKTWQYSASEFPPIAGAQRLVFMKLIDGELLVVSFTDSSVKLKWGGKERKKEKLNGMEFSRKDGTKYIGYGMFAAVSYDDGKTWPIKKLLVPENGSRVVDGGGHAEEFIMDTTHSEPMGYLAATQSPDGVIHLVSSKQYYSFNLKWLES